MAPKTARRINGDGTEEAVPLTHDHVGDALRVRPGEKIPVDGVIPECESAVDESMLRGGLALVTKHPEDKVIGATMSIMAATCKDQHLNHARPAFQPVLGQE